MRVSDIWNCDETGIQTSANRPPKVFSQKGKRQVGVISSAERGQTVTALCCCNAAGVFIPPALVFKRKRMQDYLLAGTPEGTLGLCTDSGWITRQTFIQWLTFFVDRVKPTKEHPALLILDNHESHRCIEVLELATSKNVVILSVPPHTTHRLQPLDVGVYASLSTAFEMEVDSWQKAHPLRRISQADIGALFGQAFAKSCKPENAVAGFYKSGIYPFNDNTFTDDDFAPAAVSERDHPPEQHNQTEQPELPIEHQAEQQEPPTAPQAEQQEPPIDHQAEQQEPPIEHQAEQQEPLTEHQAEQQEPPTRHQAEQQEPTNKHQAEQPEQPAEHQAEQPEPPAEHHAEQPEPPTEHQAEQPEPPSEHHAEQPEPSAEHQAEQQEPPTEHQAEQPEPPTEDQAEQPRSATEQGHFIMPHDIMPVPQAGALRLATRKRRSLQAEILTSSPVKALARDRTEKKVQSKRGRTASRGGRGRGLGRGHVEKASGSEHGHKRSCHRGKRRCVQLQPVCGRSQGARAVAHQTSVATDTDSECFCIICGVSYVYPPEVDWIQCSDCRGWACEPCTAYEGTGLYLCDNCSE